MYLTKKQAEKQFRELVGDSLPKGDAHAKREEWGIYTDMLCKDGAISQKQYNTWACPF